MQDQEELEADYEGFSVEDPPEELEDFFEKASPEASQPLKESEFEVVPVDSKRLPSQLRSEISSTQDSKITAAMDSSHSQPLIQTSNLRVKKFQYR